MIVDFGVSIDIDLPEHWEDLSDTDRQDWLCEKATELIRSKEIDESDFIIVNCEEEPDLAE